MTDKSNELAIIIYSCDRNNAMWDIVMYFFKKYWSDCPYKIVLLTDIDSTQKGERLGFDEVVECDSDWSTMMEFAIDTLKVPYFITWMDDFLLCDKVDTYQIEHGLDILKNNEAINYRLVSSEMYEYGSKNEEYGVIVPGSAYSYSTHAGIWDSNKFKKQLVKGWSAWDFERKGSTMNSDIKNPILISLAYQLPYIEAVRKGKWFPDGVELLKQNNIDVKLTNKPIMSKWDFFVVNIKNVVLNLSPTFILKLQNLYNCVFHRNRKTY